MRKQGKKEKTAAQRPAGQNLRASALMVITRKSIKTAIPSV